jgi:hypothetical protein
MIFHEHNRLRPAPKDNHVIHFDAEPLPRA